MRRVDKIRTLIVDDEPHARAALRLLLGKDREIEIVGEAAAGAEAAEAIRRLSPDLMFLDVQMPEMDAFELLAELDGERIPRIVFVTAYDRYALQAFDVNALDYLLKPFDDERFDLALGRAKEALRAGDEDTNRRLSALLASRTEAGRLRRLSIKSRGRVSFLDVAEIDWIEAADQYVQIHTGTKTHLLRESMSSIEAKLSSETFCRIHRSAIVNVERIKELHPQPSGDSIVVLHSGAKLKLGRNRKAALESAMGL